MHHEFRQFCIGEREVGRLYNVIFYERTMRDERRRGESDRGDQPIYFGIRYGRRSGPRVDGFVLRQALAGNSNCIIAIAKVIEEFYG